MDLSEPLFIGHSHIGALVAAAESSGLKIEAVAITSSGPDIYAEGSNNGALASWLIEKVQKRPVISLIGGNSHNIFGLLRHERPFDFVLPEAPTLPLEGEMIPVGALKEAMQGQMKKFFRPLRLLRAACLDHFFHMESPPPIGNDTYIAKKLDDTFRDSDGGVPPIVSPTLRFKLWRLHSWIMRDFCITLPASFVPCPEAAVVEGFLRPDLYRNATHANAAYGAMLLEQVAAL